MIQAALAYNRAGGKTKAQTGVHQIFLDLTGQLSNLSKPPAELIEGDLPWNY